jgi:ankyrin repeat/SOCS box protein 13
VDFLLRQRDVRVNHLTKDGRTALYAACEGGNAQCVQLLIDAGAHIDLARDDKSTPLITAAYYGRDEVVEVLVAAGAKLHPRDSDGTALENARRQKHARCVELLEKAERERGGLEAMNDNLATPAEVY